MLADEAFALHFMQDIYAAGHIAGTWGDVSQRKGTHDYYNQYGLEVHVWKPGAPSTVLMGDAHMRPEDAERAGEAVRLSIEQLLDTAAGRPRTHNLPYEPKAPSEPDSFDVCSHDSLEPRPEAAKVHPEALQLGVELMRLTPIPSLEEGLGAMPRFRAEVGPFIGVAGTLDARYLDDGFTGLEGSGYVAGADLSLRVGMGLEGVLGEAGDGLIFLAAGYRGDAQSSNDFVDAAGAAQGGSLTAAIPGRTALNVRVRMPFYLIPGDLLLLSPLYFISPTTYQNMAVTAGNGGLIPWQLGWATRFGRFQFVLGREIGVTFYGELSDDTVFAGSDTSGIAADHRLQVDLRGPADSRVPPVPRLRHHAIVRGHLPALRGHRRSPRRTRHRPRRCVGDPVRPRLFAGCPDHLRLAALLLAAPVPRETGL